MDKKQSIYETRYLSVFELADRWNTTYDDILSRASSGEIKIGIFSPLIGKGYEHLTDSDLGRIYILADESTNIDITQRCRIEQNGKTYVTYFDTKRMFVIGEKILIEDIKIPLKDIKKIESLLHNDSNYSVANNKDKINQHTNSKQKSRPKFTAIELGELEDFIDECEDTIEGFKAFEMSCTKNNIISAIHLSPKKFPQLSKLNDGQFKERWAQTTSEVHKICKTKNGARDNIDYLKLVCP